jgi:hypothetical protein
MIGLVSGIVLAGYAVNKLEENDYYYKHFQCMFH